ncbi:hypothetical protein EDE15_1525 [Edaphobacter aggregans]|uniref:Uncharacterized protein n=1 Tax=Edaphobacter aggregans TaxID=570835 RepID=A0A3R9NW64_9BACT|nr:hypothetical protein EDE15_1525 [Edaphobacter aggregans]
MQCSLSVVTELFDSSVHNQSSRAAIRNCHIASIAKLGNLALATAAPLAPLLLTVLSLDKLIMRLIQVVF